MEGEISSPTDNSLPVYVNAFINLCGFTPTVGNENRETLRISEVGNSVAASAANLVP